MAVGKLMGQGRTAEVYEFDNDKILKLFKEGFPKQGIEYEYNTTLELVKNRLPVPKVYELIEHEDRFGIVYEKISGMTLMKKIVSEPWNILKYSERFAQMHFDIQKTVKGNLVSYKDRLIDHIFQTELLENTTKEWLKDFIGRLPDGNAICHGDFHPDNILVSEKESFVIDWMTAAKGNPLSDVARTIVLFKFAVVPEEKPYFEKKIINLLRKMIVNKYINHYVKISGASLEEIEKWELPIAAARLIEWIPKSEKDVLVKYVKERIGTI